MARRMRDSAAHSVGTKLLEKNAVTSAKLKNGSLRWTIHGRPASDRWCQGSHGGAPYCVSLEDDLQPFAANLVINLSAMKQAAAMSDSEILGPSTPLAYREAPSRFPRPCETDEVTIGTKLEMMGR